MLWLFKQGCVSGSKLTVVSEALNHDVVVVVVGEMVYLLYGCHIIATQ